MIEQGHVDFIEDDTDDNAAQQQNECDSFVECDTNVKIIPRCDRYDVFRDELWKLFLRRGMNLKCISILEPPPSVSQFPEAMKNLSRLETLIILSPRNGPDRIYNDLIQICHNLKSISIDIQTDDEMIAEIISVQSGLKELEIVSVFKSQDLPLIGESLITKQQNSLEEITFGFHICLSSEILNSLKNLKKITLLELRDSSELKMLDKVEINDLSIVKE
ncbi:4185_t:CDS:1 [Acaulospora colombiana]|uniref:4185_t:CDS:1 n=1 Tax=Acaulospora colombiana TaxID=27376 RepID=A0ACA9K1H0_9GLOM|nr:4185_t:CDS:1 [Acaulospora colombiana]